MAVKLGDAFIALTTKDELDKGFDAARKKTSGFMSNMAQGIAQGMGQAVAQGIGSVIRLSVAEIGKSIQSASSLQETMSKVGAVFGDSTQEILAWSKNSATAFGLTQQAALEATATLGNMFRQMGEGSEAAAGMSQGMVELAADIASFHNVAGGAESVLNDMQSAFRGEYDPIQKYIPLINAASVEQQALAETGKEAAKELTALEKAVAVQTLIMQGAGLAAGDFARTIGGVANQQRILIAQIENGRAALGQAFTPIVAVMLRGLNQLITQVSGYGEGIIQSLANGMVDGIIYLLPVIRTIRDILTYWLKPGSPPRVLPDIDKWGKQTLEEYLKGMSNADFGILRGLGDAMEGILRSFVGTGQVEESDLVRLVFGSQAAIAKAISEWSRAGKVSAQTMEEIRRAAGPAGDSVANLIDSYFDLQKASEQATRAQEELTRVTARYDNILNPLQDKLDDVGRRRQKLADDKRLQELGEIMTDPNATLEESQDARLEAEEIRLQRRIDGIEAERDTAVEAEQQKLDAAKKEEEAKRALFEREQAALDQQVKTNSLIAEEISLRERLAAEALAKQEEALRAVEQAQREAERAAKEQEAAAKAHAAELERLYQAQLSYNLTTSDTAGKIALMRLELGRYKEGSVEYYQILEQIYTLEQQLAKEREAGAGGGGGMLPPILPPVDALNIPSWASDLADKLQGAIDQELGPGGKKQIFMPGLDGVKVMAGDLPTINEDVKNFVDAIKALTGAIAEVTPGLQTIAGLFGETGEAAGTAAGETETSRGLMQTTLENWAGNIKIWKALVVGDWDEAWRLMKENMIREHGQAESANAIWLGDLLFDINGWLTSFGIAWSAGWETANTTVETWLTDIDTFLTDYNLLDAATALLTSFYNGLSSYWDNTIQPWWEAKTKWIADLLPGSEPKNPASPLRGLARRGEALMENLGAGMEAGAQQLQSQFTGNLAGLATAGSTANYNTTAHAAVSLNFYGNVTPETIRNGVATADDELKRRGYK
jgi:hypothetical protein